MLQFVLTKGIGEVAVKKALSFMEDTNCSWEELSSSYQILSSVIGLKDEVIQNIESSKLKAEFLIDKLNNNNIKVIVQNEKEYPQYLKNMLREKCPSILFVKGNISLLNSNAVGFCGSRKVSQKGIDITTECAHQFAKKDITVVSGYAAGTDLVAHKATLEYGGNTIFVLAEGILRSYIKGEIKHLLNENNHVFVSQFMPETIWNVGNAMKRNGTIIGLSKSMILVESGLKGGTFAAGEEALRVHCPLFVIDFANPEVSAEANPYFISKGGYPIRGKNGIPNLDRVFYFVDENLRQPSKPKYDQIKLDI